MEKDEDRRIQIFEEDDLNQRGTDTIRHPTQDELSEVNKRILQMQDLSEELERIGLNISELTHLIALNIYFQKIWEEAHQSRVTARDRAKKRVKRWEQKTPEKYDSKKHLNALAEASARELFSTEEAKRAGCLTKQKSYIDRLLYDLKKLLNGKTRRPYRYIAAIFNTFNLHPENFCGNCRDFNRSKNLCGRKRIFTCPRHTLAREKTRMKINGLGTLTPSLRYPR